MINFISYLLIFICISLLSINSYLTIVYVVANILLILGWFIVYFLNKKKYKQEVEKGHFSKQTFLLILFISLASFMGELKTVNLAFGFIYLFDFVSEFIGCIKKKDYAINGLNINFNRLFDIYTLICLVSLFTSLMNNQI